MSIVTHVMTESTRPATTIFGFEWQYRPASAVAICGALHER